jgi:sulfotransferase
MQQLFFLSGIARSGSTLLGSMLNQNPDIYVSPTSPLMDIFCLTELAYDKLAVQYTYDKKTSIDDLHRVLAPTFYKHIDKPYVFDKHRGWPKNIPQIKTYVDENPKVVCTYRPIADSICSFLKLISNDPNNSVDQDLRKRGLDCNTYNRAMMLWYNYASDPYHSLQYGLANHRKNILVVEYDDIINNPQNELDRVYDFLGIPKFQHTFDNIVNTCAETKDEMWGFKDLHEIRPSISKTSNDPKVVLGRELMDFFKKFDDELLILE